MANQYQIAELEQACLINILLGIKYNLFTAEQLRVVSGYIPVNSAIYHALEPLIEFDVVEQGAGPQSLDRIRDALRTEFRAPAFSVDNFGNMSLQPVQEQRMS